MSLAQLFMDGPTVMFFRALSENDQDLTWERMPCAKNMGDSEMVRYMNNSLCYNKMGVLNSYIRVRAFSHSGASFTVSAVCSVLHPLSPRKV